MKKLVLLATTALALTCFGGQALTIQAAGKNNCNVISNGNRVIITYKSDCNIQNILDKLESCFPGISLPECEKPETDVPEAEQPEDNQPENDVPEAELPEDNRPEVDVPENTPGDMPENDSNGEITPEESPESDHAFIGRVVELVNEERAKEGLKPLSVNKNVQAAAMVRAKECEQLFSHTRPNGTSFSTALKEQNVSYRSAGENIAWGQKTPEEVVNAWMNSKGHRANIMNPNFTTIGVGYYENAKGTDYWCQLFAR